MRATMTTTMPSILHAGALPLSTPGPTGDGVASDGGGAPLVAEDPVVRARNAGITAVWTGDCSGTVELARLAGPHDALLCEADAAHLRLPGPGPWRLAVTAVRAALYRYCLVSGTQFDIYRWVNLADLATVWASMRLPTGVRREWGQVLLAAGLVRSN